MQRGLITTDENANVRAGQALRIILGGNATITLQSKKTSDHYTYTVKASDKDPNADRVFFVSVLTGPDNSNDYTYLGIIDRHGNFHRTAKSTIDTKAPSFRAFDWTWNSNLKRVGAIPESVEIWHEGRCCRCNRKLTVPESIASGFGPECAGR